MPSSDDDDDDDEEEDDINEKGIRDETRPETNCHREVIKEVLDGERRRRARRTGIRGIKGLWIMTQSGGHKGGVCVFIFFFFSIISNNLINY